MSWEEQLDVVVTEGEIIDPDDITDYVYDRVNDSFIHVETGLVIKQPKALDAGIPTKLWEVTIDKKGEAKQIPPSATLRNPDKNLSINGTTWWPGKPRILEGYAAADNGIVVKQNSSIYNTCPKIEFDEPPESATYEPWLEHMKKLYCEVDLNYILDYFAHMLQKPDERCPVVMVLGGGQGVGKDLTLEPFKLALNDLSLLASATTEQIVNKFNGHYRSLMCVIPEIKMASKKHTQQEFYESLKAVTGESDWLFVELKAKNPIRVRNAVRIVATTNHLAHLRIEGDDRRYFVPGIKPKLMDFGETEAKRKEYFHPIWKGLKDGNYLAVLNMLMERDISKFDSIYPPMTEAKRTMVENSQLAFENDNDAIIHEFFEFMGGRVEAFFMKDIHDFINHSTFDDNIKIARRTFHNAAARAGYQRVKRGPNLKFRNGDWRSDTGFVCQDVFENKEQAVELLEALSEKRPLTFDFTPKEEEGF